MEMNQPRENRLKSVQGEALVAALPPDWREPTLEIARVMAAAGHRVWVVGGAVRDAILGRPIKDVDLVSAALPDEVEALFERTLAVGKSFGIVVIVLGGHEIELATFREERGYSDRRRPDEIRYARTPEVDARRRDFTCNALFLDPLTGEIADPSGGLEDLRAGVLRAVGEPELRFREDGLRLLRAGRFLAALGLVPAAGLLEAMASEVRSIEGVSPERVLDELSKILRGPDPAHSLEVLGRTGALDLALPGWGLASNEGGELRWARVLRGALEGWRLAEEGGEMTALGLGLAALLSNRLADWAGAQPQSDPIDHAGELLTQLRTSRDTRNEVLDHLRLVRWLHALGPNLEEETDPLRRGELVLTARNPLFPGAAALAVHCAGAAQAATVERAVAALGEMDRAAPADPVELSAGDALSAGMAPGPALGTVLRDAKRAAVGGVFNSREEGLAWLRKRVGSDPGDV